MADDNRSAIEQLFRTCGAGVGRYVLARVGDRELSEEITARVFLAVVRGFHQVRGTVAAWLWAIVRNELTRHFRDRRDFAPADHDAPDPGAAPPDQAARTELNGHLQAGLARLSDEQQQIVYMKFFQDMRNTDIAAALGLSPTNVGVLIHRALKRLREIMEPQEACVGRAEGVRP